MQEKFEQIAKELPQLVGVGCEVRVKGLGYSVQRAKGSADEPTVGDNIVSLFKTLACLPLLERLRHGKVNMIVSLRAPLVCLLRSGLEKNDEKQY